jgi:thymidylate synthase
MHLGRFENFTECYLALLDKVMNEPQYESAPRGQNIREILGASFTIENPRDRIPYVAARKFGMSYMIAELVWYLSGSNRTDWISKYSAFWSGISDDGETANSAYGARLFKNHPSIAQGRFNQLDYIIKELTKDPDSRRAVMHLRVPDDSIDAKLDVPCTLALQYFIRGGKLHQVVNMRSSDLVFGIAYDIPAFTIFQEMIANELGIELGTYTHVSNSLHIYETHFKMVNKILEPKNVDKSIALHEMHGEMPALPGSVSETLSAIGDLFAFEEDLQTCESLDCAIESLDQWYPVQTFQNADSQYFEDWAKVLTSARLRKLELKEDASGVLANTEFTGYSFNTRGRSK